MTQELSFDAIRPYFDHEAGEAIERIIQKPSFYLLMGYFFPDWDQEEIKKQMLQIDSIYQFQKNIIHKAIRKIVSDSTNGLTWDGIEELDTEKAHLFVSNHRDIIMDPALLNILLFEHKLKTTSIAIGDNLMFSDLVSTLMKLNKSFVVNREGTPQQIYNYSQRLSAYIRNLITKDESVWIAQRNGRAKDGNDQTQIALLKMFDISGSESFVNNFAQLHITPMAISYEYDPCDMLKVQEWYNKLQQPDYKKSPEEDKMSIIQGIRGYKGRVHLSVGNIVSHELNEMLSTENRNERYRKLASVIDQQIWEMYKLWPNNYIASDMLDGETHFSAYYTQEEKEKYLDYAETQLKQVKGEKEILFKRFLSMYAQPLRNQLSVVK